MVVAFVSSPNVGTILFLNEIEQLEAVFHAGINVRAVEITERVDATVVREINGVSGVGIGCETRVLEHSTMEDEFEHQRVCAEPTVGLGMSPLAKAMVWKVRTEIIEEWVF